MSVSPRSLYKNKRDRFIAERSVALSGADAVRKFTDRIGLLPGSKVEKRYSLIWNLYEKYKDKALSQEEIDGINKELGRT